MCQFLPDCSVDGAVSQSVNSCGPNTEVIGSTQTMCKKEQNFEKEGSTRLFVLFFFLSFASPEIIIPKPA